MYIVGVNAELCGLSLREQGEVWSSLGDPTFYDGGYEDISLEGESVEELIASLLGEEEEEEF